MISGKQQNLTQNFLLKNFQFTQSHQEEEIFHQKDLIQLFPFGVSLQSDSSRPFLLLKDEKEKHVLPVAVNPIEAGVTLSHADMVGVPSSPHRFTTLMMESLGIEPKQCVFVQIQGPHQYVRIYMSGHPSLSSIRLRAEEAMSLCLHLKIPIYASLDFINRSKVLVAEIQSLSSDKQKIPFENMTKPKYMM